MKIIYINGIKTTEQEANEQVDYLNRILKDEVVLCYNPTYGFGLDLLESFYNRAMPSFMPSLPVTQKLKDMIETELWDCDFVTVIAHSQGTAIAANALEGLHPVDRSSTGAVFFAPVNSQEPKGVEGEIFLNDEDYVHSNLIVSNLFLRIARLFSRPKLTWKKYTRRGNGHALKEEYLDKLSEFTGYKDSKFYELMNGVAPYKVGTRYEG